MEEGLRVNMQNLTNPTQLKEFDPQLSQQLAKNGFAIVPADACEEAKAVADYITKVPGGRGCIREGIELILKAQGKWVFDEDRYDQLY